MRHPKKIENIGIIPGKYDVTFGFLFFLPNLVLCEEPILQEQPILTKL